MSGDLAAWNVNKFVYLAFPGPQDPAERGYGDMGSRFRW
jgi:hypothetical protein